MSSNSRELHAVLYSVMAAAPRLRSSVVLVETDNSTTMAYVNHLGGRSRFLSAVAHRLWSVTNSYGITLRAYGDGVIDFVNLVNDVRRLISIFCIGDGNPNNTVIGRHRT